MNRPQRVREVFAVLQLAVSELGTDSELLQAAADIVELLDPILQVLGGESAVLLVAVILSLVGAGIKIKGGVIDKIPKILNQDAAATAPK